MKEFLNPKSMVTPGVAGATMMFLVNGLSVPFPDLPARYVALGLSFMIGLLVVNAVKLKLLERGVYWVLNSLVIFVVGFGANSLGHDATTSSIAPRTGPSAAAVAWLIPAARASDDDHPSAAAKPKLKPAAKPLHPDGGAAGPVPAEGGLRQENESQRLQIEQLKRENEALIQQKSPAPKASPERSFFKKW